MWKILKSNRRKHFIRYRYEKFSAPDFDDFGIGDEWKHVLFYQIVVDVFESINQICF